MKGIEEVYGGRIRLRVCGVLENQGKVLLVNHKFINKENIFWNFPGGGLDVGEDIEHCLVREFREETNLEVEKGKLLYLNEHFGENLHAIELYFKVTTTTLDAKLGRDPEWNILSGIQWFTLAELKSLPKGHCPDYIAKIAFL